MSRISFEFFPPKSETGFHQLHEAVRDLAALRPRFVTVTCGAGGSAIDGTLATVKHIGETFGVPVAPHIAYSRHSRTRLGEVLRVYRKMNVREIIAIRGDPVANKEAAYPAHDTYATTIEFVSDLSANHGFEPIIAAYPDVHPLAESPQQDMDHLKRKVDAGAKRAITQFFFEAETFLRFRDKIEKEKITVTLIPGVLRIQNIGQALKFAAGCGAKVPNGFADRFGRLGDDPSGMFDEGITHAIHLCETLHRAGVEDFHFYALNRSAMLKEICAALKINLASASTATD